MLIIIFSEIYKHYQIILAMNHTTKINKNCNNMTFIKYNLELIKMCKFCFLPFIFINTCNIKL